MAVNPLYVIVGDENEKTSGYLAEELNKATVKGSAPLPAIPRRGEHILVDPAGERPLGKRPGHRFYEVVQVGYIISPESNLLYSREPVIFIREVKTSYFQITERINLVDSSPPSE